MTEFVDKDPSGELNLPAVPKADPPTLQSPSRRLWLGATSSLAVSAGWPAPASADTSSILSALAAGLQPALPRGKLIDQTVVVSAARLDLQVARNFPDFNVPAVLPAFDPSRHGARYAVELHRIVVPLNLPRTGESLTVTGLLALPVGVKGPLPVVSWQHGTVLNFDGVPSSLIKLADPGYVLAFPGDSAETLFNIHRFAAQGYAVIAADYVGKGPLRNGRSEAYAVPDVTVQACLRILEAGLASMQSMGLSAGPLFLNGWSQGGINSQWLHQALRQRKIPIAATSASSPFNELTETVRFWSGAQTYPVPDGVASFPALPDWIWQCLVVLLGSYEVNYGITGLLHHAVRPQFRELTARYWQTYELRADAASPRPTGPTLLVPGFFDRFTHDTNSAFLRQIAANSPTYWRYDAPIRFYLGIADEALHPTAARRAIAAGGALATEVAVPGGSHRITFMASLYGEPRHLGGQTNSLEWFNTLRGG